MEGTSFGPYRVGGLLGRGGMGEVYRAFDTETDRIVALKLLPASLADDGEFARRFQRECRAAARLREPHVVPIHRFGEIEGRLYLDMRLVEGQDLAARLAERGPLPPVEAVGVVSQVAAALDAAHAEGMVHRDVKPSNVLLAGDFAYLFDFGIATALSDGEQLTQSGMVPGSLAYMAPERFQGAPADPRMDTYALACLLVEALSGRPPFRGDLPAMMRAHLTDPPPWVDTASPALNAVVARGMAKDPTQRYPTAGALAAAARDAVRGAAPSEAPTVAHVDTLWSGAPATMIATLPTTRRRRRWPIALAAAVLLVGAGVAALLLAQRGGDDAPAAMPPATTVAPTTTPTPTPDEALFASLPAGFTSANCVSEPERNAELSSIAFVTCQNGPSDGPRTATFGRYETQELLDRRFDTVTSSNNVQIVAQGFEGCRTGETLATSYYRGGTLAGRIGCFHEDGAAFLYWSDSSVTSLGYIRRDDDNAALLYDWWLRYDFRK